MEKPHLCNAVKKGRFGVLSGTFNCFKLVSVFLNRIGIEWDVDFRRILNNF